jgi:diguanylate cyclase (GGDEF)-like protein
VRPVTASLSDWIATQEASLEALRAEGADRGVLLRLLETSCLLELSKLGSAQLDLASLVELGLDVVTQFFPVRGCVLRLRPPGLPEIRAAVGEVSGEDELYARALEGRTSGPLGEAYGFPLFVDAEPAGLLALDHLPTFVEDVGFFATVARHLSEAMTAVAETERLRRQVAGATALQVAASFSAGYDDDRVEELAAALAALPNATGAAVAIDSAALVVPLRAVAGVLADGAASVVRVVEGVRVTVSVAWGADAGEAGEAALAEIVGRLVEAVGVCERQRRLAEEAETDPLTGVGNRRRASRALAAALNRADRYGEPVAVLLIDLDHFKQVNDDLGHEVGDALLRRVGELLHAEARSYDTVARIGGDEFVVVCPTTDTFGGRAMAERLRRLVREVAAEVLPAGREVTASIGIAVHPLAGGTGEELLRAADAALYEVKRAGRDGVAHAGAS